VPIAQAAGKKTPTDEGDSALPLIAGVAVLLFGAAAFGGLWLKKRATSS
jgi:hypothetical protein